MTGRSEPDHLYEPCGAIPHPSFSLFSYHCPHTQTTVLLLRAGDESEPDGALVRCIELGPFDTEDDFVAHLNSMVLDGASHVAHAAFNVR